MNAVEVRVLGPVQIGHGTRIVPVGGRHPGLVLALLATAPGRSLGTDALAEAVWGEQAAVRSRSTLQVHVSALRRMLGFAEAIVGRPGRYTLAPEVAIDLDLAMGEVAAGRRMLAAGDHAGAAESLRSALDRRRGELGADLGAVPALAPGRAAAAELFEAAYEERIEADLALGRHAELVVDLEQACREHPLRERRWGQLMVALYRTGRQSDALAAYRQAREVLREQVGLDPGPALAAVERAVLSRSAGLDPPNAQGPALLWWDRAGRHRSLPLDGSVDPVTVGRAPTCGLPLADDPSASRRHAEVRSVDGSWWVRDEAWSANGTWLNAERVAGAARLGDGDVIRFGDTVVLVRLSGHGNPTPPDREITLVREESER